MSNDYEVRTFAQLTTTLEDGQLHDEMTSAIKNLIGDLENHHAENGGKPKGKLALTINFKLDNGAIDLEADFKVTAPKATRHRTVLFVTPNNGLSRANPKQQELPLRDVGAGRNETKAV